jgi:amino acid adenylation domain-containing protein
MESTERLPASYAQNRLWFIDRLGGTSPEYNMPVALRLRGDLDRNALVRAINAIVERHESLRTHFAEVEGEPVQVIEQELRVEVPLEDLSGLGQGVAEERVVSAVQKEWEQAFDLDRGPLLRLKLLRLGEREHVLLRTMHHIVSDGWSEGIFNREFIILYEAFRGGSENPLESLAVQYGDFAVWQRKWLEGAALDEGLRYWKKQLAGMPERLELPVDRLRPAVETSAAEACQTNLSTELSTALKCLSQENQATLYMTLLTVFGVLLSHYSGQGDVVVGTPIANRQEVHLEELIGCFVNTLVMRVFVNDGMSFRELLRQVRETALGGYHYQDVPFERLVEELSPDRRANRNPLFQVIFALQNVPWAPLASLSGLEVEPVTGHEMRVRFDLESYAWEQKGKIVLYWLYNRDLFERWRMDQMLRHYVRLLEAITRDVDQRVGSVDLLEAEERRKVLYEWNDTAAEYPSEKCVHELFEEQVEKSPEAVAVVYEEQRLTYRELNGQANRLAHYLRELGVKPDERVAICVERGLEMVVGLLAVLKAGGAYVPLDPAYPEERLRYMLEDSAPAVLLTQGDLQGLFPNQQPSLPVVDLNKTTAWSHQPESNLSSSSMGLTPEHLVYIIYTSGSTGMPKGVMNEHRGICNRLVWMQCAYGLSLEDAVLQKTPFSFDVSVWEFFWPLLAGARLVMAKPEGHKDPNYLCEAIQRNKVTTIHFVPSMLQIFLEQADGVKCSGLERVVCSGEALPTLLVQRFWERLPRAVLHNLYGPTEAAVDVTAWTCRPGMGGSSIPIGRPIANTRIYILDVHGEPVPVGVAGEIHIAGAGVARGYWKRPELTAEKFVKDPFVTDVSARMYKTGDVGRWLADGNIEFLGRNDEQVKIRGYRIELGEIEATLARHPRVREAVVIAREDEAGEKRLVGYYVAADEEDIRAEELRAHLLRKLPEYMVPAAYVRMERMPLTANGKLDRKALPLPEYKATGEYCGPRTPEEEILCALYAEVLGLERVGIDGNFFELGGHSLQALRLISRIRSTLQVEVPIEILFNGSTIRDVAQGVLDVRKDLDLTRSSGGHLGSRAD